MNDFLKKIWLDNPVQNYLIVAGIILFVLLLKRFISRYLAGLLYRLVHKIWKEVDKKSFTNLLVQPLGFFLVILVTIVALHKLKFPAELNLFVYEYNVKHIVHAIGTTILIVSFIWLLLRIIDFVAMILEIKANLTPDQSDNQLVVFFRDFFKVIIAIIGVLMVLNYIFDVNVGSLITGLSIIGAAIALALRESLENLIASFIIFFDKPFTTGDIVKVLQITGTVEKIGLRSTRIRSDNKTYVSVPNKQMVDSVLDNLSLRTQRKGELKLDLSLETTPEKLREIIPAIKKAITREEIEDSNVFLTDISQHSFYIHAEYFTAPVTLAEFNHLKQEINFSVLELLRVKGVEFAANAIVQQQNK